MEKSVIIGAGNTTRNLIAYIEKLGYSFSDCFSLCADNNRALWGTKISGVPIGSVESLKTCPAEMVVISSIYEIEIREQLQSIGISERVVSGVDFRHRLMVDYQINRYHLAHPAGAERKLKDIGKLTVYTTIIGGYDSLIEVCNPEENVKYICFTDDRNLRSDTWEIRYAEREFDDPILESRKYKMLPHRFLDAEYSLYVDANVRFQRSPLAYMRTYFDRGNMLFIPHMERDCIYREMAACITGEKDLPRRLVNQAYAYSEKGCPEHVGLFYGGVIGRRHQEEEAVVFNEEWWGHFRRYSRRDQLSLGFLLWEKNCRISLAAVDCYNNDWFFVHRGHKRRG